MGRSGSYVKQPGGFKAFNPAPLPPKPAIKIEGTLQEVLERANFLVASLDGLAYALPNTDLFVAMYVRKEALLSAQIEGTQATLEDIFAFDQGVELENINDVQEVINYIKALKFGVKELKKLPLSIRLIKELHAIVVDGVRGETKDPGSFRKIQNWIGPAGSPMQDASFIPPSPQEVPKAMGDLEKYLHAKTPYATLVDCALIHYQFETIHPFLDGNGRLGRLLITFYLMWKKTLTKPLLYLSYYLKKHRQEYYDRLNMVRNTGDYEQWILFFLKGVALTAESAIETIKKILALQVNDKQLLWDNNVSSALANQLITQLFYTPLVSVNDVEKHFNVTYQAASNVINQFVKLGILTETTGKKRDKRYLYERYMKILAEGTQPL